MPRLVVVEGPNAGRQVEVEDRLVLGSHPSLAWRLDDPVVEPRHALLADDPRGFVLHDLTDAGATLVNDAPVETSLLRDGDRIRIGDTILEFQVAAHGPGASGAGVVISESSSAEIFQSIAAADATARIDDALHERFKVLLRISGVIGLRLDLERILEEALSSFFEVFPKVERGVILLVDPATGQLSPRMFKKRNERVEDRIAVPRTILERVATNREAIVSADAMADSRFASGRSIMMQRVRFMMCTPMICQEELLGAIYLDSTAMVRFDEDDLLVLNGIGAQVAVAIKNAQMNRSLREKEQLEREIAIARTIQQSLLPRRIDAPPGWEIAATSLPARRVGGDFYDVLTPPAGQLCLVVGDVSGKGIAAALYMAGVLSELRFLLNAVDRIAEVARMTNEGLVERETMGMFVTGQLLTLDPATGDGAIVCAGHPPALIRRADGRVESLADTGGGPPFGVIPGVPYEAERFRLERGDSLVLYTDGVLEATSPDGELYGAARLSERVLAGGSANDLLEGSVADATEFAGRSGQRDDLTLVVARRTA